MSHSPHQDDLSFPPGGAVELIAIEHHADRFLKIHEVLAITRVVRLESSPHAIVSSVSKVYSLDDRWLIADRKSAQVKAFGSEGQHMYDVGSVGKGPGEWLSIGSLDYDPGSDQLAIFSDKDTRLNLYRADGTWIKDLRPRFFAAEIAMLASDRWAFLTKYNESELSQAYNLLFTDANLEIVSRHMPYNNSKPKTAYQGCGFIMRQPDGQSFLLQEPLNDTIFGWQADTLRPKYRLDFGEDAFPEEEKGLMQYLVTEKAMDYAYQTGPAWELDDYLLFRIIKERRQQVQVWDRSTGRLYGPDQFDAPLLASLVFRPVGSTTEGEWIIGLTPEDVDPQFAQNDPYPYRSRVATQTRAYLQAHYPEVFAQLADWQEDDNYALLCVRLTLPGTE